MIRRIPVVPEADGTLRVICGDDILEIEVVPPDHPPQIISDVPPPVIKQGTSGNPVIWRNPLDKTVMFALPNDLNLASTSRIFSVLQEAYRDPKIQDPHALVVGAAYGIDLHHAVDFAGRMESQFPDTELTINLGLFQQLK